MICEIINVTEVTKSKEVKVVHSCFILLMACVFNEYSNEKRIPPDYKNNEKYMNISDPICKCTMHAEFM